jgi:hypothetical protein
VRHSDCYVYLLVDTTDLSGPGQGFFNVGKGTGARFFDHFDEAAFVKRELEAAAEALRAAAAADGVAPSESTPEMISREGLLPKAERLAELLKRPGTVRVDILRRDLTQAEAFLVESAAIDMPAAAQSRRLLKAAASGRKPRGTTSPAARPGQLRDLVQAHLAANPDADVTPHAIGRVLSRSSGAVANALDRLTALGQAQLTSDKPRRYRHQAPASTPAPAGAT